MTTPTPVTTAASAPEPEHIAPGAIAVMGSPNCDNQAIYTAYQVLGHKPDGNLIGEREYYKAVENDVPQLLDAKGTNGFATALDRNQDKKVSNLEVAAALIAAAQWAVSYHDKHPETSLSDALKQAPVDAIKDGMCAPLDMMRGVTEPVCHISPKINKREDLVLRK